MPIPVIVWVVAKGVVVVGARVAARQVAKTVAKKAAEAAVKKVAKESAAQVAKKGAQVATKVSRKKGSPTTGNTTGRTHLGQKNSTKPPKKKKKDPCKHKNDKKKKKYIVYKADEFDKAGNKMGTYVGRTSGNAGEHAKDILNRRLAGHHRNVKHLERIFETESYAAVRGAEQALMKKYSTVKQINGIGPKNKNGDNYKDCAKLKGID